MLEPLSAEVIDQARKALVQMKMAEPCAGDGPLDFKEKAIWKMAPQVRARLARARTEEEAQEIKDGYHDWIAKVNALEKDPDEEGK